MSSAACFISGHVAPGAALDALLSKEPISLAAIDLVCCEQQPQEPSHASTSKYNVVLVASCSQHSREALSNIARCMAPGARLYVYEAASISHTESATSSSRVSVLKTDLLLSGFTDAEELSYIGANATQPAAWLTARLPQWGLGAAAKLSLKRPAATTSNTPVSSSASAPAPAAAPAGNPASVWKLAASDGVGAGQEDEDELLDDEQLLTEEDKKAAPKPVSDDCEVGASGRKACKNCTCGRAEAEAAGEGVKLTADMLQNPQSACGSCYLGDAFRCATCPYRGLPSFEPGQKISLGASMLAADV